jgi:hypothetical protein
MSADHSSKNINFCFHLFSQSKLNKETIKLTINSGDIFSRALLDKSQSQQIQLTGYPTISGLISTDSSTAQANFAISKTYINISWPIQINGEFYSTVPPLKTKHYHTPTIKLLISSKKS